MAKKNPDELKIKLILKVDKALYNRITEIAKEQKFPGTIEDTLKKFCMDWFKDWAKEIERVDNPQEVATPPKQPGLLGPDGKPLTVN